MGWQRLLKTVRVPTLLYGASVAFVLGINGLGAALYIRRVENRPLRVEPTREGPSLPSPDVWLEMVQERLGEDPTMKDPRLKLDAVQFQDGCLRLGGVVPLSSQKARVEQIARDVARDLKAEVLECSNDLRDPLDLVRAAIARKHPAVRLSTVRILERKEDGKKKRVVALAGMAPTRSARYEVAETARTVLNEHGFTIADWDTHDLLLGMDHPPPK